MFFIYINLEQRIDRMNHMQSLLRKYDLPHERFNAIKPSMDDIQKVRGKLSRRVKQYVKEKYIRAVGVIGCYLSHYKCLLRCKSLTSFDHVAILEDDLKFTKTSIWLLKNIVRYMDSSNKDWDMLRVTWNMKNKAWNLKRNGIEFITNLNGISVYKMNSVNFQSKYANPSTRTNNFFGGTHFQIINRKKVDKILKYLDEEKLYNIDSIYSTNKLNIFFVTNSTVMIKSNFFLDTDIPKI